MKLAERVHEVLSGIGGSVSKAELAYQLNTTHKRIEGALDDLRAEGLAEPTYWRVPPPKTPVLRCKECRRVIEEQQPGRGRPRKVCQRCRPPRILVANGA